MDVHKEEIKELFKFISCTPPDEVLDACVNLCTKYGLSAEDITDHWSAFTISNKNAPLTVENVLVMERKEFAGRKIPEALDKLAQNEITLPLSQGNNVPPEKKGISSNKGNYKRTRSPEISNVSESKRFQHTEETIDSATTVSQASMELEYLPEISYVERKDAGQVVQTFGQFPQLSNRPRQDISVRLCGQSGWYLPEKFFYLYNSLKQVSALFNSYIEMTGRQIFKKNFLGEPEMATQTMSSTTFYGRIRAENDGEKLNGNTVRLECSLDFYSGKNINLNISQTKSFSLIPGEVVAVQGSSLHGNAFIAQTFYNNAGAEFSTDVPRWTDNMQIVVAAGPYTICNNLSYQPLQDLLKHVVETQPDILILLGPFIDYTQPGINQIQETFEVHFENLIESIMGCFKGIHTKVVLVPSQNDAHHHPVYPSPAYKLRQKYPNLTCASDPCMIDINGLIIGITNVDVLFHLTTQEISRKPKIADRMSRLASHLLNQRSFYPLYPPQKGLGVDYETFLSNCGMHVKPHVLVLPSMLRNFVKNVDQCLVINPERLVKNYVGGTFAVINVAPADEPGALVNYLTCQIRKI